jgi:tRNA 5-methylaminomethyl-2-thiouridine biosynthesis bifunctional protein
MPRKATFPLVSELLQYCHLPAAWAQCSSWTVLDTEFGQGAHFLATWAAWRSDPDRPRMLHYVGLIPQPWAHTPAQPSSALGEMLYQALADLGDGFSRLVLDEGLVALTLCPGELQQTLKEQHFQADSLFLGSVRCDKWTLKLLARKCHRGTRFAASYPPPLLLPELAETGFILDAHHPEKCHGVFDPRWEILTSRRGYPTGFITPGRCAVIGAGISGAMAAHGLALRGWKTSIFDSQDRVAGGASGLPVGLAVPHVSLDDGVRSRLSRVGVKMLLSHAKRLLTAGQDWSPCGVMGFDAHWHPEGAWLKPETLIRALADDAPAAFHGGTTIHGFRRVDSGWWLSDAQGHWHGSFDLVIFASAMDSSVLIDNPCRDVIVTDSAAKNLRSLHPVHGMISSGRHDPTDATSDSMPPTPVNGNGSFIPRIPTELGDTWYAGATFERNPILPMDIAAQHQANLIRLTALLPATGAAVASQFVTKQVGHWTGTRCVTHDRLPLVGPLNLQPGNGLWIIAGMGARGLSFSAICAEILVARICGEPLPVEASLARCLDAQRVQRKPNITPFVENIGLGAG